MVAAHLRRVGEGGRRLPVEINRLDMVLLLYMKYGLPNAIRFRSTDRLPILRVSILARFPSFEGNFLKERGSVVYGHLSGEN